MGLSRDIRLRVAALAQEFQDDGQNYCAADLRAVLAHVDQVEADLAQARAAPREMSLLKLGAMESTRLRQLRSDISSVLADRGSKGMRKYERAEVDAIVALAIRLGVRKAAAASEIPVGTITNWVRARGGLPRLRSESRGIAA